MFELTGCLLTDCEIDMQIAYKYKIFKYNNKYNNKYKYYINIL